ncbi:MAG: EamA family transporter [Actinomycetota bacterium]
MTPKGTAPSWLTWTALWVVYLVWGSTYLAIRVTVETIPPLLSGGVRFFIAGLIVYVFLLVKRKGFAGVKVTRRELLASTAVGTLLLLGGNGSVNIAEVHVPSALAALIIAAVPLWVVLLRVVDGDKVARGTMAGVFVGFIGVSVLVLPGGGSSGASLFHLLLVVVASISWATGSFFSKKLPLPKDPFLSTGIQMLTGGVVMTIAGVMRGETSGLDPSQFSAASIAAFVYLIVFGSLLAFTAYVWLLQNAPISKVSTYAYVNPVVAILLGWLILDEKVTPAIILGASIIVVAVATVIRIETRSVAPEPASVPATDSSPDPELEFAKAQA